MYGQAAIDQLIKERGFQPAGALRRIQRLQDATYLNEKFALHDRAEVVNEVPAEQAHIVTGFGPTSAPTGGTLSVIFKAASLRRSTGLACTIVISNLGAWCSRRLPAGMVGLYTEWFLRFIESLGLAQRGQDLRTHEDLDVLRIAGLLTRFLSREDFEANQEATAELYGRLGLLGNEFGVWTDTAYTVADILEPLVVRGKARVLVLAGLEEHYFVDLARIAIQRMHEQEPGCFLRGEAKVGGLYAQVVRGLHPYPKMSKSIPASAVSLADSPEQIYQKVAGGPAENDPAIMQLITMASDWDQEALAAARKAFTRRHRSPGEWQGWKQRYAAYFLHLKELWERARPAPGTCTGSVFPLGSVQDPAAG